jgi:hypothetical protein
MNPFKVEDLVTMWKDDAPINVNKTKQHLLEISNLHAKYSEQWVAHTIARNGKIDLLKKMRGLKYQYYDGKLNGTDQLKTLGWEPFPFKLKSDIKIYMDADKDILELEAKISMHEAAIGYLNSILKAIENRGWNIKTYAEFEKYELGLQS